MTPESIGSDERTKIFGPLREANLAFQKRYPEDPVGRQPVHTVYGGADLYNRTTIQKLGEIARTHFLQYAPNARTLTGALDLTCGPKIAEQVYRRVKQKLATEAVEDFRIDFEDGFGNRGDEEEDETARFAAAELAASLKDGTSSPFIGIRIKPFTEDLRERSVRTLDLFLTTLLRETGGAVPENFVVMLPKVTIPEQITALVRFLEVIERAHKLSAGSLRMEMMIEQTQAIFDASGRNPLMRFLDAAEGRMKAVAFGTYDYTAHVNITAKYQTMSHPACDFAHHVTRTALGHTGVWLSDGATNVMPVGPHRDPDLSDIEKRENREAVHRGWKESYDHIRHSLYIGLFQGWDLNPAQLPARYAAVYCFFLESYADAAERLRQFVDRSARATLTGDVFDDAATGQGLLNYFLAALNCGAITEEDTKATGLTLEEIRLRSFYRILEKRRKA